MKNLTTAIYAKATGSGLHAAIGGRLYKGSAPQNAPWPHVVFFVVVVTPKNTFKDHLEEAVLQFKIFSKTSSSLEIENLFALLKDCYEDTTLSITGNTFIAMDRQSAEPARVPANTEEGTDEHWEYDVFYDIIMQRNNASTSPSASASPSVSPSVSPSASSSPSVSPSASASPSPSAGP